MSKKSQEHPYIPALNGEVLRTKHDKALDERQYIVSDHSITMSNALTRAVHRLTLSEKRLIMLAVSKLNPLGTSPAPACTKIFASEYAETYDVSINTAYEQLKSAGKVLYSRSIMFFDPAHKRDGKPIKPAGNLVRWVGRATYHDSEAWIELAWWSEILPHLIGLKKNFTEYQLKQVTAIRSIHSWRLLELLIRFKSSGWAEYTIEDFAESMEATTNQKANFGKIRTQIIEPALKELIEKDGWTIKFTPILAGRRVRSVRFDFNRK